MEEKIFDIDKFNIIQDEDNYYLFRALNLDDQREINEGLTTENGVIQRVITNKQRYPENDKYADREEISLQEVWDHTKSVNFYKGTNCISLSSNANVSIDYGSKYGHKYLMIKVPKEQSNQIYNAGQYMLVELNRVLDKAIRRIPQDSEVIKLIDEIEGKHNYNEIKTVIGECFKTANSNGKYTSQANIRARQSMIERFNKRQAFSEEQQLEYNKVIGKLTLLESYGMLPKEIFDTINISSLTSTIGSEFSNREFVHYGEISSEELMPISKINIDIFGWLQAAKEQGIDPQIIDEIERIFIEYTNQGLELVEKDGKLFYSNGKGEIDLGIGNDSILVTENSLDSSSDFSIDEMFERTNGTIGYSKSKNAAEFVYSLSIAQRKSIEIANILKTILNDDRLNDILEEIGNKSIAINDDIITRKNGRGIQISESVNIDMNRGENKLFSNDEQRKIYEKIKSLSVEQLDTIISKNGKDLEQEIYIENLDHSEIDETITREERLNRYYAETIIDTLDISQIYRNAIKDKSLNDQEREQILNQLEKANCKRLVEAFIKAGIAESEVAGYIINILASNGYQGYTFEELSKLDNLDDIISRNIKNTNLKGHVYPSVMEELRGIRDNDNRVGDTFINLRDYQQETVDNIDEIYAAGKRFAGVVLPTGAGKSFIAMAEMLKNQNGNILYIAPQKEILNQVQRHILKYIAGVEVLTTQEINELKEEQNITNIKKLKLPEGKILPNQVNEYVKKVFPHLKMFCYQGLASQDEKDLSNEQLKERNEEERELREILKNADANLIVLDELHRSGAKTWKGVVEKLIKSNDKANILGITATPIRDVDHVDMMKEIAKMTGTYADEELTQKKHLAYEMYLTDAIQRGIVVEPKIVSFDFMLRDTEEYKEILEMIEKEQDEDKKKKLEEIKSQIDELLNGDTEISEYIKNNISQKEIEEIGKIIKSTIRKKDGRYIVFLPQNNTKLPTEEYIKQEIEKVKEYFKDIDADPEIGYLMNGKDKNNFNAISNFENSDSPHIKLLFAIDKLNEGVHIDGINGEIMLRKINNGSTILYLQQLGRAIFAIDPDHPLSEDEIPIVYDIYNNYLVQNLNRTINETTPKSDLQKLQEVMEWMDKHGYIPDINSENTMEARKAITLKKIQTKYKKYIDGIDNPRLSESDIYEIEQVMELANAIDLFNMEIGDRIIPPGEKELDEVQLFKVTAVQKKFMELYKDANKVIANVERHKNNPTARLNDVMNILETLNSKDVFIDNNLIQYNTTLKELIEKCPEEIQASLYDELSDFDEKYPIGKGYNFAKASFRDHYLWKYYADSDVKNLYACGIFEDIDKDYIDSEVKDFNKRERITRKVLDEDFIIYGNADLREINVKTGTIYNEKGQTYEQICSMREKVDEDKEQLDLLVHTIQTVYSRFNNDFSFVNENIDEIPEGKIREIVINVTGSNMGNADTPKMYYLKQEILKAREYIESNYESYNQEDIIEFKKYGILPINIDENGLDKETKLPKEEFGVNLKQYKQLRIQRERDEITKDRVNKTIEILEDISSILGDKYSFANENIDELPNKNLSGFLDKLLDWLKLPARNKYLPTKYSLREEVLFAREHIEEIFPTIKEDKSMLIKFKVLGVLPLKFDSEGNEIETGLPRDYFKTGLMKLYTQKEEEERQREQQEAEAKRAERIRMQKEREQREKEWQERKERKRKWKEEEKERKKREKEKRYNVGDDGYNSKGEYLYKGKLYPYNPLTGKKADGTYAVEARDERGFNPDRTYKDTGDYYDENGLDYDYKDREGFDTIYHFDKDGYYYEKNENGEYVNTGLKYNPMGFGADKLHVVTKTAVDVRGFTIDGNCIRNENKKYDRKGFKQDGTHKDTGESYYNGYNAFGVDKNGKNEKGKTPREIIFAKDFIINGVTKGNLKATLKKYGITSEYSLNLNLYTAAEMWPQIKLLIRRQIFEFQTKIEKRENKIAQLEKEKSNNAELIKKLKKDNERLKKNISYLNPMEEMDK